MKPPFRHLFACTALTAYLTFAFAAVAQDAPKADEKSTPAPAAAPAAPTTPPVEAEKSSELRRIDGTAAPVAPEAPEAPGSTTRTRRTNMRFSGSGERLAIGHDVTLGKDERADAVVAILGSATSDGEVGDAVVSIVGNTRVTGRVGDSAVAVLGSTYVNGKVGGEVVAVLGNVELGPDAEVSGDVVSVGGRVIRDAKAIVHGDVHNVGVGPAFGGRSLDWLLTWFRECGRYGRVLWIGPNLGWAWGLAISFLVLYFLIAALFRSGVEKCVTTFETRPGSSIIAALLTILLSPVLIVLLCVTVVGIALLPFVALVLMFAAIFGKAVMLAWIGRRITKFFGDGPLNHPAFAVLLGGLIVLGLYMIPVVGIITFQVLKLLGLGVAVYCLIQGSKREKPVVVAAAAAPVTPTVATPSVAFTGGAVPLSAVPLSAVPLSAVPLGAVASEPTFAAPPPVTAAPPIAVPASTLPRAGFWIRIGALLLDFILIGIILAFFTEMIPRGARPDGPQGLFLALATYGAIMWKLKGTTIGGIVCGLKIVRTDGRAVDWPTAVVRALSCFLSAFVAGLGFLWIVIDDDKQSWHDKISGTAVVRVPKGMALV
jgi:uncharacterized RDD family membrane protein YckC